MNTTDHWQALYGRKAPEQLTWYRAHLERSLSFIERANVARAAAIIDVGGGTSTLVDDLLARGYENLTVLDVSPTAIDATKARLGDRGTFVHWLVSDVIETTFGAGVYDFWHDRAAFHFLRDPTKRHRYVAAVRRALKPGGHLLVATFGPEGPERCSGLEVVRYGAEQLHAEFGRDFEPIDSATEIHVTPSGSEQQFVYCFCRKIEPQP